MRVAAYLECCLQRDVADAGAEVEEEVGGAEGGVYEDLVDEGWE